ncbi:MAG: hypothetical protein FJ010_08170 [Chloroflexi bacterium]|nr:hypothetical protein [Chloroflexota bacterium]
MRAEQDRNPPPVVVRLRTLKAERAKAQTQRRHVPGIFVMNADMGIGETIEELLLIWGASDEEEYHDNIWFLPSYEI